MLAIETIVDFRLLIRNEAAARLVVGFLASVAIHIFLLTCNCIRYGTGTGDGFPIVTILNVALPQTDSGKSHALMETESRSALPSPILVPDIPPSPVGVTTVANAPPLAGPEANIFPLPTALYISTKNLTVKPVPTREIELDTPEFDGYLVPGRLTARLYINEIGFVDSVVIDQSNLPPIFSGKVLNTFSQARFTPGEINGKAVKSQVRIEVDFDPKLK